MADLTDADIAHDLAAMETENYAAPRWQRGISALRELRSHRAAMRADAERVRSVVVHAIMQDGEMVCDVALQAKARKRAERIADRVAAELATAAPAVKRNDREDEPCPDGECKHTYDDWPRDSVTQRDREMDQCERCLWTAVERERPAAPASATVLSAEERELRPLLQSAGERVAELEADMAEARSLLPGYRSVLATGYHAGPSIFTIEDAAKFRDDKIAAIDRLLGGGQ